MIISIIAGLLTSAAINTFSALQKSNPATADFLIIAVNSAAFTLFVIFITINKSFRDSVIRVVMSAGLLKSLRSELDVYGENQKENKLQKTPGALDLQSLQERLDQIEENTSSRTEYTFSEKEKLELAEKAKLNVLREISDQTKSDILRASLDSEVQRIGVNSLRRISDFASVMGARASWSLTIGTIFCGVGVGALVLTFFTFQPAIEVEQNGGETISWFLLTKEYLPRLSLIFTIEIIGFFFLRLYTKTLSEIKLAQNELTNIEMRLIALNYINNDEDICREHLIKELSKTERNYILEKGQTTQSIEEIRIQSQQNTNVINAALDVLNLKRLNNK